jgi:predicted acyltransferase
MTIVVCASGWIDSLPFTMPSWTLPFVILLFMGIALLAIFRYMEGRKTKYGY